MTKRLQLVAYASEGRLPFAHYIFRVGSTTKKRQIHRSAKHFPELPY